VRARAPFTPFGCARAYAAGMPTSPTDPKLWRLLSTLALLVAVLGLVLSASFGWIAFLLSGIFFAVELVLARRAQGGGVR